MIRAPKVGEAFRHGLVRLYAAGESVYVPSIDAVRVVSSADNDGYSFERGGYEDARRVEPLSAAPVEIDD